MTEWTEASRREFQEFTEGNKRFKDPIERALKDISDSLNKSWVNNRCQSCPLGELAALASATLTFYQESKR